MLEGQSIAVVMPAYNEEALVATAIARVPAYVDRIIVIDDASTDRTREVVGAIGDARIELCVHDANRGVGAAIATGYKVAFRAGVDVAVVMAGDAQMDPADIPSLVTPLAIGSADYAKGNRLAFAGARAQMPMTRWLGNHVLSLLTRLLLGVRTSDSQCGFTAMSKRAFERLRLDTLWPRYGYPNDLLAMVRDAGLRTVDIVVRPIYGTEKSGIGWKHALFVIPFVLLRARARRAERRVDIAREPSHKAA